MAKSRSVVARGPSKAYWSKRQVMKRRATNMNEERREHGCTVSKPQDTAQETNTDEFSGKRKDIITDTCLKVEDDDADVLPLQHAVPLPITQSHLKVIAPDGRVHTIEMQTIPGFEHLLHAHDPSHTKPSSVTSPVPDVVREVAASHASEPAPDTNQIQQSRRRRAPVGPRRKSLKRSRSVARTPEQIRAVQTASQENATEDNDGDVRAINEISHTFYIGDFRELMKFFRRRLDELTMKPLRPIVTAWIKQLEPKRLGSYGPYHKKLPSEMPLECTPRWWPQDVPYEEPSHLGKAGLLTLAVDVMLQHRTIDAPKRHRGSWVAKMQQAAIYAVETTPPEHFSSARRIEFSDQMRNRALEEILPTMFEAAKTYEDHLAQYNLYEDCNNVDPGTGIHISWQAASRPARSVVQSKRVKYTNANLVPRLEATHDSTDEETDIDDAACELYLRKQNSCDAIVSGEDIEMDVTTRGSLITRQQTQDRGEAQMLVKELDTPQSSISEPHTPSSQVAFRTVMRRGELYAPCQSCSSTPNTSFNRSMHPLQLDEEGGATLDAKLEPHIQYNVDTKDASFSAFSNQALLGVSSRSSPALHYPNDTPNYRNQVSLSEDSFSLFDSVGYSPCLSAPLNGFAGHVANRGFVDPLIYSSFPPRVLSNDSDFPYGYDGITFSVPTPGHDSKVMHGLPTGYALEYHS